MNLNKPLFHEENIVFTGLMALVGMGSCVFVSVAVIIFLLIKLTHLLL